jgi:hypothetical protein
LCAASTTGDMATKKSKRSEATYQTKLWTSLASGFVRS